MVLEILLLVKFALIALVVAFHSIQGRHAKGVILAVLVYIGIPDITDAMIQPVFSDIINVSMPLSIILYFGIVWLLVFLVWKFM